MQRWLKILIFIFLFPTFAFANCQKPIKFAGLDWESGSFLTAILETLVVDGYHCPVESVPGTGVALENALAQDDIQVIAEVWSGRSPIMQKAIDSGKVKIIGDLLQGGATQGWYIPDYTWAENPNLRHYKDLPQFASLFKRTDNTRPRFLNCPTGWTCETFNTRLLQNTGLEAVFENVHPGVGAALDAEISAAYEQKKPILFYYWQPTGLMAKYHFKALQFPNHDKNCWQDLLKTDGESHCISGFPVSPISIAVSSPFLAENPTLKTLFERVQFTPSQLNGAILEMQEKGRSGKEQARLFLKNNPHLWQQWLPSKARENLSQSLSHSTLEKKGFFPAWSFEKGLNQFLKEMVQNQGEKLRSFSAVILQYLLEPVEKILQIIPPWLLITLIGILAWHATRRLFFALFSIAGLYLIGALGLWVGLLQTLSLLMISVLLTVILGIPIGIFLACRPRLHRAILPILDVMQTMPSFVYLIPVLMLFGLGKVPALLATLIYAIAPLIRLTALGIQQVSRGMTDAGLSLGMTRFQLMRLVTLPLAKPSIMAGLNQTVMMSLSMVVLASMIGAPGLGEQVLQAIQTLNIGQGIQAGGAIVLLAIIIDRITQAYGRSPTAKPSH